MSDYQTPDLQRAAVSDEYSYGQIQSYPSDQVLFPASVWVRSASSGPVTNWRYRFIKRAGDLLLVLAISPLLIPAILLVSLCVFLSSPGPIFYSHRRIRRSGTFFSMWKFRTMCVNSAEVLDEFLESNPEARTEWKETHKLRHDPRVTAIGRFLRRYSLDELPQIWNVVLGQMTLVGPRPIVAAEVEKYDAAFDCYCSVIPGVTGLWQVSGRSRLSYDERVALDCEYVAKWSLSLDARILVKTLYSVVMQDGAF